VYLSTCDAENAIDDRLLLGRRQDIPRDAQKLLFYRVPVHRTLGIAGRFILAETKCPKPICREP
ncbi:hypothetical protein ACC740_37680, partial [Rhizobium ruizarguesonis]